MDVHALRRLLIPIIFAVLTLVAAGASALGLRPATSQPDALVVPQAHLPLVLHERPLRLAVIGDYGTTTQPTRDVAALVRSWQPDAVLTTGDNNYPAGEAATIDHTIGAHYHAFIAPYYGQYGAGSATNRFFPTLGNHDWMSGAEPYLAYFTLPGNERYYDVALGPVHLFALDSDPHEPDGVTATSIQARWLEQALAASPACWKLVTMHHAPFSSGPHGSTAWMQWPYQAWGADLVLAGHDHTYERLLHGDLPYFVNGLGGNTPYAFGPPVAGSQRRFTGDVGAMLIEVAGGELVASFITRGGQVVDTYRMHKDCPAVP